MVDAGRRILQLIDCIMYLSLSYVNEKTKRWELIASYISRDTQIFPIRFAPRRNPQRLETRHANIWWSVYTDEIKKILKVMMDDMTL